MKNSPIHIFGHGQMPGLSYGGFFFVAVSVLVLAGIMLAGYFVIEKSKAKTRFAVEHIRTFSYLGSEIDTQVYVWCNNKGVPLTGLWRNTEKKEAIKEGVITITSERPPFVTTRTEDYKYYSLWIDGKEVTAVEGECLFYVKNGDKKIETFMVNPADVSNKLLPKRADKKEFMEFWNDCIVPKMRQK